VGGEMDRRDLDVPMILQQINWAVAGYGIGWPIYIMAVNSLNYPSPDWLEVFAPRDSVEGINQRLLLIAFLITMPEYM
jgi:hypothetical protein